METQFDSKEEMYVSWWLEDLKAAGFVRHVIYQPEPFQLFDSVGVDYYEPHKKKIGGKFIYETLIKEHIYTPDFKVIWTQKAINLFAYPIMGDLRKKKGNSIYHLLCQHPNDDLDTWYSYLEVKGTFDKHNMIRLAIINQKWIWKEFGQYMNITNPKKLFNNTFTPKRYFFTDNSGKPRKLNYKRVVTLEDCIKEQKEWMNF